MTYGPPVTARLSLSQQEQLRRAFETCSSTHEGCRSRESGYVPLRLIEISRDNESFSIRLRSRDSISKGEAYVALSYCWGGDQSYKTTKALVNAYSHAIPWEKVGKTIQHAVDVAYNLRIRHIWVDALCIVQDDKDELDREIPNMPEIYNQAQVTIVASQANSAAEGFLADRRLEDISNTVAPIRIRTHHFKDDLKATAVDLQRYLSQPTEKRGWCFQEKWLARRMIEFETTAVRWSCGSVIETLGLPVTYGSSMSALEETKQRGRLLGSQDSGELSSATASDHFPVAFRSLPAFWEWVVSRYSNRKHTIPADRAIAISGLAQVFGGKIKSAYAAGLWEESLPLGLMWQRHLFDPGELQARLGVYQGPSWSWTSYSEITDFQNCLMARRTGRFENRLESLDVKTVLASEMNPFGAVTSGTLTVKGNLKKAWLMRPDISLSTREQYDEARRVRVEGTSDHRYRLNTGDANQVYYSSRFDILVDPMPYNLVGRKNGRSTDGAGLHTASSRDNSELTEELDKVSLSNTTRDDTPEWLIPFRGSENGLACAQFPEGYDLGRFGTLLAARMQSDAFEEEFLLGNPGKKDYLEVFLLEIGWFSHVDPQTHLCGPVGLALRELAPGSNAGQHRRRFSRLGTFNFDITCGLLRPPELSLEQWKEIVHAQMDWFSDCEAETIEIV